MARGRMLNKSVSASVKFDLLADDTCRLMATWTVAHLDRNGVFYGDPVMVKSFVFPRRADVTVEQVEHYLSEMQRVGLICLFKARGQLWQYWPGFDDNQVGLRADRESTEYPDPPVHLLPEELQPDPENTPEGDKNNGSNLPEDSRNVAGNLPETIPPKRSKKKRRNSKEVSKPPPLNQEMFGVLANICAVNWQICTEEKRGELNQVEKILRVGARASPDDLKEFRLWWDEYDWRGKKRGSGDPPTPAQVRDEWQKFVDWRQGKGEMPVNGVLPTGKSRNDDGSYNV